MFLGITLLSQCVPRAAERTRDRDLATGPGGVRRERRCRTTRCRPRRWPILVLAANTAYADFPRLASILARDGYLPRQFMNQGDRLAFSNGIVGLSLFAATAARRVRRRHACADPALHDRRVRLLHPLPGRHGDPLAQVERARMENQRGDQRIRRGRHRRRARHRRAHEDVRRRLDRAAPDSDRHPRLQDDTEALRPRGGANHVARVRTAAPVSQYGHRSRRRPDPARCRSAAIRRIAVRRCSRRLCRWPRRARRKR